MSMNHFSELELEDNSLSEIVAGNYQIPSG